MIARTDWTVSALATELGLDRRTLAKRLTGLQPIREQIAGKKTERFYMLAAVLEHLAGGDELDLNRERAVLTKLQQRKLEMELAELRGELLRAPAVELHWQALIGAMRAKLLTIPSYAYRIAPDRVNETAGLLTELVHGALHEIAGDGFPADVRARLDALQAEAAR